MFTFPSGNAMEFVAFTADTTNAMAKSIEENLFRLVGRIITLPDYLNTTEGNYVSRDKYTMGLRVDHLDISSPAESLDRTLIVLDTDVDHRGELSGDIWLSGLDLMRNSDYGSAHGFRKFKISMWNFSNVIVGECVSDECLIDLKREWNIS